MLKITIRGSGIFSGFGRTTQVGRVSYGTSVHNMNGIGAPYSARTSKISGAIVCGIAIIIGSVFAGLAGNATYNFPVDANSTVTVGLGVFNYTNAHVSDKINPEIRGLSFEEFISSISKFGSGEKLELVHNAKMGLDDAQNNTGPDRLFLIKEAGARLDFVEKMIIAVDERLTVIISLSITSVAVVGLILLLVFLFKPGKGKKKNFDADTVEPMY